jgi:outer membrane receptor protein involved in Fe transport
MGYSPRLVRDLVSIAALGLALVALVPAAASAQVDAANVGGVVTDDTGAAIPGATVTITNRATGVTQTLTTGTEGNYRAVALQPGPYEISTEIQGFAPQRREITLTVGADATVNFRLGVAGVAETLTVVGESPLVEVTRAAPSSVIEADQLKALPVISRNFLVLAQTLPGVSPATGRFATSRFGGGADPRNGYTTIIDGGDIDDAIWGSPTINMTQDAVQEFKVYRNQFDAQYGQAMSAVVTVVTKSGTNNLNGSAFYFGRDQALNATDPFATTKPPFKQTRLGGSFGGPIFRDKAHYFAAYEYLDVDTANIVSLPASNPFAVYENGVFPTGTRNDMAIGRVDYRFNDRQSLYVRYAFDDQEARGDRKPSRIDENGVTLGTGSTDDLSTSHSIIANQNWILSSNKVNTLRVHLLKHEVATIPNSFDLGVTRPSASWGQSGIAPQYFPRTRVSVFETLYINTARHDLKIGGDFTWGTHDFEAHFNEHGRYSFNVDPPFTLADTRTWPFQFVIQKPGFYNYKSSQIAAYIQDDWRVTDRIRANIGLRYDLDTNLRLNDFYTDLLAQPAYAPLSYFISGDRGNDYNNLQPRLGVTWDIRGDGTLVGRGGWGLYITRNRPWFQLTAQDQVLGSAVLIQDPLLLRNYPDINATLGGRTLDEYIAAGGVRQVFLIDDNYVLPYQQSTTVGVGWQINNATSLDVDYVHSYGDHQLGSTDRNLPPDGAISATNPRPVPQFSRVTIMENYTKTWYDAFETQIRTRVRGANTLQVSYTLARNIMDGVDFYSTIRGTQRTPQEKGYNSTDNRHILAISASTELPWGFRLSGIARLLSGRPKNVTAGIDLDGDGNPSGDRPPGLAPRVGRADVEEELRLINEYRATQGRPAVGMDLLDLNEQRSWDLRLTKVFPIHADQSLELFLEAFNVTNIVNLNNGSNNMRLDSFLIPTGTNGEMRQVQWGARYVF